ncbi:MAG: hypothetical protein WCF23_09575 [Candidatus Nitrosopolaris sp.]
MLNWSTDDDKALDDYIIQAFKALKSIRTIGEEMGVSHNSIRSRIKRRHLNVKVKKKVNDWKAIAQHIRDIDLPFYRSQGLYPMELRQMYYRLIELGIIQKVNQTISVYLISLLKPDEAVPQTLLKKVGMVHFLSTVFLINIDHSL